VTVETVDEVTKTVSFIFFTAFQYCANNNRGYVLAELIIYSLDLKQEV
jgi:hypothetical protein